MLKLLEYQLRNIDIEAPNNSLKAKNMYNY